jgi:rhodanese-related sulfurtransferase
MQRFIEFFFKHWDLFLVAAFLTGMLVWQLVRARVSGFKDIDPSDAVGLMNHEGAVVVDVREDSEYKDGHVLGSIHIPLGSLKTRLGELEPYKGKPVIVNCRSGHRSASGCGLLAKNGFERLYNLRGGIGAWQGAGLPTTKSGKSKKK